MVREDLVTHLEDLVVVEHRVVDTVAVAADTLAAELHVTTTVQAVQDHSIQD